jgi:hypothetical protein
VHRMSIVRYFGRQAKRGVRRWEGTFPYEHCQGNKAMCVPFHMNKKAPLVTHDHSSANSIRTEYTVKRVQISTELKSADAVSHQMIF